MTATLTAETPDTDPLLSPMYGGNHGLPADALAAYGARLIVTQDGHLDWVPDRADLVALGPATRRILLEALRRTKDEGLRPDLDARDMLREYVMRTDRAEAFTWEAEDREGYRLTFYVDTMGSHGYLYLTAFLQRIALVES